MEIDLNTFSNGTLVIDLIHLVLGGLSLLFLVLWLSSRGKSAGGAPAEQMTSAPEQEARLAVNLVASKPDSALQLLSLFQQEGRLLDFLHEDLAGFSDAEIGAVARVVHDGSKKVLDQYFVVKPLREEAEEASVTLAEGFDPATVRLTGNVTGQAPFTGTLLHRGWKAEEVKLPKLTENHDMAIIAPAEVEL